MGKSDIEWTDWSWNILGGCTEKSPGCANCYARRMSWRMMHNPKAPARYQGTVEKVDGDLRWTGQVNLDWGALVDPEPLRMTTPRRIFVCSMSDLFHPSVPTHFLDEVFAVMATAEWHQFVVLTKRAQRMATYMASMGRRLRGSDVVAPDVLPNVIGMVTAETQAMAEARIPWLLRAPLAIHGVSLEPLLGEIDLTSLCIDRSNVYLNALTGCYGEPGRAQVCGGDALDWAIVGGETGPGARPMHPDWVRWLRDQCCDASFFFKSWGAWGPSDQDQAPSGVHKPGRWHEWNSGLFSYRVGKRAAGRALDGEIWDEIPGGYDEGS